MNGGIASLKMNPCAAARALVTLLSRSAVAFSFVISSLLKNVPALQSTPMNSRGYPSTTTVALGARLLIAL